MRGPQVIKIGAAFVILALVSGLIIRGLNRTPPSDHEQILDTFLAIEEAVNRKSVSGVMRHVSADYDDGAYTKRGLTQLAIAVFRESESFNAVSQVRSLDIRGETASATVDVDFWVGDDPAGGAQRLELQLEMKKSRGKWQVTRAQGWEQAQESF